MGYLHFIDVLTCKKFYKKEIINIRHIFQRLKKWKKILRIGFWNWKKPCWMRSFHIYYFNVFTSRKFFDAIHCFSDLDIIHLFVATGFEVSET